MHCTQYILYIESIERLLKRRQDKVMSEQLDMFEAQPNLTICIDIILYTLVVCYVVSEHFLCMFEYTGVCLCVLWLF